MSGGVLAPVGAPSLFRFLEENFPPGAELVGFVSPEGREYSAEDLKAIEWRERQMDFTQNMPENVRNLLAGDEPKKKKEIKALFETLDGRKIMLRSDDTLWELFHNSSEKAPVWLRIRNAALPAVPQED